MFPQRRKEHNDLLVLAAKSIKSFKSKVKGYVLIHIYIYIYHYIYIYITDHCILIHNVYCSIVRRLRLKDTIYNIECSCSCIHGVSLQSSLRPTYCEEKHPPATTKGALETPAAGTMAVDVAGVPSEAPELG